MIEMLVLWFVFCFFSFGVLGLHFIAMKRKAVKPWRLKLDNNYMPKVSILVPTYNELAVIRFKLENLYKINYPKELIQIIVVDSNSDDGTLNVVKDFVRQHPEINMKVLAETQRRGKSAALNFALKHCEGDVVIVSDADCFWPSDILCNALPFLADEAVGAVSGPKILLNSEGSLITRTESFYLNSMNLVKLGESKLGSTLLFEGGFSAYKKKVLESFDPYNTGSDDCGTVVGLLEKGYKAILVPEARFYSSFPASWREKLRIKLRRANQLVRVLWRYFSLILRGRLKSSKRVVVQGILTYLFGPIMFIGLLAVTAFLLSHFPYFALIFLIFFIPKVRFYLLEIVQNYLLLFISILAAVFGKKFIVWRKPKDRILLQEHTLRQHGLI